ncbi:MAG: twin-arginine translocase TatA/TatE family subunit [Candidatus Scalindua sp.]|jgi:sec-independent protein translocase protein TatA|nr:twin-arginine translocase TatA/TatE family subunit [Candidatus Scalindua sp.]MDP7529986.1 twin-arginine translocase TatA/TatE family subunit [Candidatus Scalindua sp.]
MFGMPGGMEWIIILIVALLIFGKRLPEVMKSMGKGIVEFKKGVKGVEDDVEDAIEKKPDKLETAENKNEKTETDKEHINEMKG